MAAHQLALSVPATAHAVTTARHQAVGGIQSWGAELDDNVVHTAALVISELLTNVVRHVGAGQILLTVRLTGTVLRIEVCDSSSRLPQPDVPTEDSESGRGLLLVAALTDRHGVEPTPTGKRCWAEIPVPTPPRTENPASLLDEKPTVPLAAPHPAQTPEAHATRPERPPTGTDRLRRGYWCECWTEDLRDATGRPVLRASFDACSAPQADRWVAIALRTITPALDAEASDDAWAWLYEGRLETRRALLRSKACTVTITHANTRITWTIRPALFLPLAHRQGTELPTCAYPFKPHATA